MLFSSFCTQLIYLSEVSSTNDYLRQLIAKEEEKEGLVVWAHTQTAGRGQRGNTWEAVPGENLTLSLLIQPVFLSAQTLFYLSKCVSIALQSYLQFQMPTANVQIKWPNDLYANGKKIGGILIENQWDSEGLKHSIVGIGINVNTKRFSPAVQEKATSLQLITGIEYDIGVVLQGVIADFAAQYERLKQLDFATLDAQYFLHLKDYQQWVWVEIENQRKLLFFESVAENGQLIGKIEDKAMRFDIKELVFI